MISNVETEALTGLLAQAIAIRLSGALRTSRPSPANWQLILTIRDEQRGLEYAALRVKGGRVVVLEPGQADLRQPYASIQLSRRQAEALLAGEDVTPELAFETAACLTALSQALARSLGVALWQTRL